MIISKNIGCPISNKYPLTKLKEELVSLHAEVKSSIVGTLVYRLAVAKPTLNEIFSSESEPTFINNGNYSMVSLKTPLYTPPIIQDLNHESVVIKKY